MEKLKENGLDIKNSSSEFILQIAGRRVYLTHDDVFVSKYEVSILLLYKFLVCSFMYLQLSTPAINYVS